MLEKLRGEVMPELPEVENVRRKLEDKLKDRKIIDVEILYKNIILNDLTEFNKIINQTIHGFKRRGKWLIFDLDDYYLISHLRMEGKYYFKKMDDVYDKHTHVVFKLDDNSLLFYNDTRKFGRMKLINKEDLEKEINVGLEPFDESLDINYLKKKYLKNKKPIKTVLLDQTIIAGIGNIYADEILFLSCINPHKLACDLHDEELSSLIINTKNVLNKAIVNGGTTIRSYESLGTHGNFQEQLCVHTKAGDECPKCHNIIEKTYINGRGTYYCSNCQK